MVLTLINNNITHFDIVPLFLMALKQTRGWEIVLLWDSEHQAVDKVCMTPRGWKIIHISPYMVYALHV
jgi:hypothetical protein